MQSIFFSFARVALPTLLAMAIASSASAQTSENFDVVVIGGGLMGSSTAWQLARRGQRVLLLEKQDAEYTEGSSFGDARISRSLGPPNDVWSYMHNRTVAEVQELIEYLNERDNSYAMRDVYVTSPVNYVRHESRLESVAYLPEQADRYEIATTPAEALALFGVTLPADAFMVREYKEFSGTINPAAVIDLLHQGIRLAGGEISYSHRVTRLTRTIDQFDLEIVNEQDGSIHSMSAPKVVSAAGPYTGSVLREVAPEFDQLITPKRVYLAFFEVRPEFWSSLSPPEQLGLRDLFPGINSTIPTRGAGSFSMIERYTNSGTPVLKIGGHFQRSDVNDLDAVWAEDLAPDEVAWAEDSLLRHLSILDIGLEAQHLRLVSGYSCVYSLTESEVPYVTNALRPDGGADSNLVVVGGLSGVGAKGSLAYGVLAADLLMDQTEFDPVYLAAREAFGIERLRRDIASVIR